MRDPQGYIIVRGDLTSQTVSALSRCTQNHSYRWVTHPNLTECFVHSTKALRRAIRWNQLWVKGATVAIPASYNQQTGYAEPAFGSEIPFFQLAESLRGQEQNRTSTAA